MIPLALLVSLPFAFVKQLPAATPDRIDKFLVAAMKQMRIPGLSLIVLKDGKEVKKAAYGLANVEYDVPAKPETLYLLASITKSFTATGIALLEEEGKLNFDDPISKYLDNTPDAWKPITIRMLLGHTAGLSDRWEEQDQSKWRLNYSTADMYSAARAKPLDFPPGTHWQYSDQGYFLLGMIIEKVSGQRYRAFLGDRIFKPLGMDHSTTSSQVELVKNVAQGYTQIAGKWLKNHRRTDYGLVSHFGIVSSVEDMAKFDQALMAGKLLKPETLKQMWSPSKLSDGQFGEVNGGSCGMGWFLEEFNGHRIVQHGGASGTAYFKLPDDKLTIIVLTNLEQLAGGDATALARIVAQAYVCGFTWGEMKSKPDPHPEIGAMLLSELNNYAKGTMDISIYEPAFGKQIEKSLPAQRIAISQLGPIQKVQFLGRKSLGTSNVSYYRVELKDFSIYATISLNKDGKISSFIVQGDTAIDD